MCKYIALATFCLAATPAHAGCLAATPVHAGELNALEAESIAVGSYHGIVYFTSADDGYRVVTTIANGEAGLPVRFEATLTETQKLSVTVPGKLGEQSQVLEMSHVGTKLVIARPQTSNDKLSQ